MLSQIIIGRETPLQWLLGSLPKPGKLDVMIELERHTALVVSSDETSVAYSTIANFVENQFHDIANGYCGKVLRDSCKFRASKCPDRWIELAISTSFDQTPKPFSCPLSYQKPIMYFASVSHVLKFAGDFY